MPMDMPPAIYAQVQSSAQVSIINTVNFREQPKLDSKVDGYIKAGNQVTLLEVVNKYWLKIKYDGKVGFVSVHFTNYNPVAHQPVPSAPATPPVAPAPAPIAPAPVVVVPVVAPAPPVAPVEPAAPVAPVVNDKSQAIIDTAKSLIGVTHYAFGVNQAPTLLDCSSYTKYVFGENGISLPWGSRLQSNKGSFVNKSDLQVGDLVFFTVGSSTGIGHVGIYIGNGQFINNLPNVGVVIRNMDSAYWTSHYVTARRVL